MATGLADSYRRGKSPVLPGGENKYLDQELRKLESQNIGTLKTLEQISKEVGDSKALIREERTIRVSENEAFAKKLTTLEAQTGDNTARITEDRTVWTTRTQALAQAVDTLSAATETELAKVRASIVDERTARTSANEALAQQVTTLSASINNNDAWVKTTTTALVNDTESLAQRVTTLNANFDTEVANLKNADGSLTTRITSAEAAITTEQTVRATADSALAQQITTLRADFNQEVTDRTAGDGSLTTRITSAEAAITTEQTARADADSALAQQITTLSASLSQEVTNRQNGDTSLQGTLNTLTSRVQTEETARADGDSALASQITSVSAAASRQRVFRQGTAPGSPQLGDLWYDTANDNIPKVWDGSGWVASGDARIPTLSSAVTNEINARASADSALAQQISNVSAAASRQRIFRQSTAPGSPSEGDLWYDTSSNGRPKVYLSGSWVDAQDDRIPALQATVSSESAARVSADSALASQISTVSASANRQRVFRQGTAPASPQVGDIWYDTSSNNIPKVYNGSSWDAAGDNRIPALDAAISNEVTARVNGDSALATQISSVSATANRQRVWAQGSAPTASQVGDLWINTSDDNRPKYWDGSSWVDRADSRVATAASNASTALANVNSEITARINGDNALSSQISTLTTSVNNATTSVSTLASSVNGVRGRYGVTINNNGHISGISLLSDSTNGSPTAIFRISAEQFAIRNPGSSTDSIFWDGVSERLVVRGDIQATSVTAGSITSTSIVDGQLGREHAYYDPNRVNVGTSGANIWIDVAATGVSISYGRTVHGTVSFAARQTDGRNGAEHRVRVLRQFSDGSGDFVCWGGTDGAPITTGYDGTTTSITFFDNQTVAGKFANYKVQMRTLFGDDRIAVVERTMFLRELSRSQQSQVIETRSTTLPPPPSGYDGGATYDPPPGTALP